MHTEAIGSRFFRESLDEIRRFKKEGKVFSGRAEILEGDSRTHLHAEAHRKQLLQEIQNSRSIEHLAEANAGFALAFLRACFSGSDYKVEECSAPLEDAMRFGELCQTINRYIKDQIDSCETKKLEIDGKTRLIEGEVLAIVSELQPRLRLQ